MNNEIVIEGNVLCVDHSDHYLECPGCASGRGTITREQLAELARDHLASLGPEHRTLLDELLRNHEHETHRLARADYLDNNGRNWRLYHDRRVTELYLRERFSLPDHPFGECCEPTEDIAAEVATLGIVDHGVDVAAAEAKKDLE